MRRQSRVASAPVQPTKPATRSNSFCPLRMDPTAMGAPEREKSPRKSPSEFPPLLTSCKLALMAPADSPKRLTFDLSPPKRWMLELIQRRAARSVQESVYARTG